MAKLKKNKNIVPIKDFSELTNEINYSNFEYKDNFDLICTLVPDNVNEKLVIEIVDKKKIHNAGLVYIFVIEDKIFKIGHTINSIIKRIQSYNCGKTEYRNNGTNSTTNYFVLQSLLKINKPVDVYAFFPQKPTYNIFGINYYDSFPPFKRAENLILNNFMLIHRKKPIGCTQR